MILSPAEEALAEVLARLADAGVVRRVDGRTGPAWLEVAVAGRSLTLDVEGEPPAPAMAAMMAELVRAALARAVEEEAHRRTRERLDMLSAASFEGIMVHVDGVVVDVNQRIADMLDDDRAALLGADTLRRVVAPEDLAEVQRRMRERIEGPYVITAVRTDGTRFRAELLTKQGHLGQHPVRIAAVRDVTERERTSAQLRESELQLRRLVEQVFDFFVYSRDGVVVDVGGGLREVLGFEVGALLGRPILDFVAPPAVAYAHKVVAEQIVGVFESTLLDVHGDHVPVELAAVVATLDGLPTRVAAVRDLRAAKQLERERRRLEQRLERSQRMESLGVLAGGIAHDFNNLLVGVLGNASLLLERATAPAEREAADAIVAAGRQAATLTAQMLAYAGQNDPGRREPVDLATLLPELRTLLAAALSKKAQLELDLGPGSVVIGNRATLTQVLMNLLTNASDALEDRPGQIVVTSRRVDALDPRWDDAIGGRPVADAWILIEVRDNGCGMDEATRERVFEPFFTTKPGGHGLGLAASFGIVAAHGGAILVDSAPGVGTCFSVALPAGARITAPSPPPPPVARPRKVLVVDDEARVRSVVRRGLELRGYEVGEAADGTGALACFAAFGADVILLDMTMPDLDGLEVARRIRASGAATPIVLSSGYLHAASGDRLDQAAIDHFLSKPFTLGELVAALERALGGEPARS